MWWFHGATNTGFFLVVLPSQRIVMSTGERWTLPAGFTFQLMGEMGKAHTPLLRTWAVLCWRGLVPAHDSPLLTLRESQLAGKHSLQCKLHYRNSQINYIKNKGSRYSKPNLSYLYFTIIYALMVIHSYCLCIETLYHGMLLHIFYWQRRHFTLVAWNQSYRVYLHCRNWQILPSRP